MSCGHLPGTAFACVSLPFLLLVLPFQGVASACSSHASQSHCKNPALQFRRRLNEGLLADRLHFTQRLYTHTAWVI